MIRRRITPDGLTYRLYERRGKKTYSIGYKQVDGTWAFRYSCPVASKSQVAEIRKKAIEQANVLNHGVSYAGQTSELIDAWFTWQESLSRADLNRRADSTLTENKREAANLKKAFGHLAPSQIEMTHGYAYLDVCVKANRPTKGNKEISLMQLILEYGVRIGMLKSNPLSGIRKNRTASIKRYVSDEELALAVEVGREKGGTKHIVALALQTAWLCVRRSVEVRGITRDAIQPDGIVWKDGKSKTKAPVLIKWSDELRNTINEALSIKRNTVFGTLFIFGNMRGQRYTKGGWKAVLNSLMVDCEAEALQRNMPFKKFSLQDCRPKAVSDKLTAGHTDTQNATGHTSEQMINRVYDRRRVKEALPVK
jgi:integrase